MSKTDKKIEALRLRREGMSIKTIAETLAVSKGTASVWCRDLVLTKEQKEKLRNNMIDSGHKGRMMGAEANKRKKAEAVAFFQKSGKKDISSLTKRELYIAGVALYWGEGVKAPQSRMAFVNSDPRLIVFMYRWFQLCFGVKTDEFSPRIFINEIHKKRKEKIILFWSSLLQLPQGQFGNVVFLKMKQKKVYENHDNYYGVLSLGVVKSTKLKYRILGLIDALSEAKIPQTK